MIVNIAEARASAIRGEGRAKADSIRAKMEEQTAVINSLKQINLNER